MIGIGLRGHAAPTLRSGIRARGVNKMGKKVFSSRML